jgi:hypothetical protein
MKAHNQGRAALLLLAATATHAFYATTPLRRPISSRHRSLARRVTTLPQTGSPLTQQRAPEDQWIDALDLDAFGREVRLLKDFFWI